MLLLFPLGLLSELLGAGFMIRLFASFGFPDGYDWLVKVSIALCAIFLVTVLLKIWFSRNDRQKHRHRPEWVGACAPLSV